MILKKQICIALPLTFIGIGLLVYFTFFLNSKFESANLKEIKIKEVDVDPIIQDACEELLLKAKKEKFSGPILELQEIKGKSEDKFLQTKIPIIMAFLSKGFSKQIITSDADKIKIKQAVEELMKKRFLYKNLKLDIGNAEAPKYDINIKKCSI